MSIRISAVIITLNEERNIERCIQSLLKVADEIIVLDSFSIDKTEEICNNLNVKFVQQKWLGYAASKNFCNDLAQFEYILSLDADEELSAELEQSILKIKDTNAKDVFQINRLTNYCGKWIFHSGWYPDLKIRLFPKEGSSWKGEIVHEELVYSEGLEIIPLQGHLNHYSYTSFEEHRNRADHYSRLTAQKYANQGKKVTIFAPLMSGFTRFVSMYIFNRGFLDGFMGFKIASISAASNVYKYKELRRINRDRREVE